MFFTLKNSVDPDEMLHNAAFHLRLHCLQKYLFRSIVYIYLEFSGYNFFF